MPPMTKPMKSYGQDVYELLEEAYKNNFLTELLRTLDIREEFVINLRIARFGGNHKTLKEIGQIMDVSHERVRQILAKSFRKLRHPIRTRGMYEKIFGEEEGKKRYYLIKDKYR